MKKIIVYILSALLILFITLLFFVCKNYLDRKNYEISKMCNFNISEVKINRYDFDGPDQDKIKNYEEACKRSQSSTGSYRGLSCGWLEEEKNSNRKDTYYEVEGLIKNNKNKEEYLRSIISKIYTKDDNKILISSGYKNINRAVASGESVPFKISIHIDRNGDLAKKYFKDDYITFDTYPWFESCK